MDLETSLLVLKSLLAIILKFLEYTAREQHLFLQLYFATVQIASEMSSRENSNLCGGGGGDILEEDLIFENLIAVKHMLLDVMETQDHANISGMYQSTSGYFRLHLKMSEFHLKF